MCGLRITAVRSTLAMASLVCCLTSSTAFAEDGELSPKARARRVRTCIRILEGYLASPTDNYAAVNNATARCETLYKYADDASAADSVLLRIVSLPHEKDQYYPHYMQLAEFQRVAAKTLAALKPGEASRVQQIMTALNVANENQRRYETAAGNTFGRSIIGRPSGAKSGDDVRRYYVPKRIFAPLKVELIRMLGRYGSTAQPAISLLVKHLDREQYTESVQIAAIRALGEMITAEDEAAIDMLDVVAETETGESRNQAQRVLKKVYGE